MNLSKEKELMFNLGVPDLEIIQNGKIIFKIETLKRYEETNEVVEIEFAEDIPEMKRGLLCDIRVNWRNRNSEGNSTNEYLEVINDLLLVNINTMSACDDITTRLYIFYKD